MKNLYVAVYGYLKNDGDSEAGTLVCVAESEEEAQVAFLAAAETDHGYAATDPAYRRVGEPNTVDREWLKRGLGLTEANNGEDRL